MNEVSSHDFVTMTAPKTLPRLLVLSLLLLLLLHSTALHFNWNGIPSQTPSTLQCCISETSSLWNCHKISQICYTEI